MKVNYTIVWMVASLLVFMLAVMRYETGSAAGIQTEMTAILFALYAIVYAISDKR